jgi:hypothetical protein
MKHSLILAVFIICAASCRKSSSDLNPSPILPPVPVSIISDSCSYTINGKQFICNTLFSDGKGNAGANLDTAQNKWNADSLQYRVTYGLYNNIDSTNDGNVLIHFVKKYAKTQLVKPVLGIIVPETDSLLFLKGIQKYAVDYDRFNSMNGIAMQVHYKTDTTSEILLSYVYASAFLPTTINNDVQKDAQFEIITVTRLANGKHIIEAKFTANLFTKTEKLRRLENGYLRLHVD